MPDVNLTYENFLTAVNPELHYFVNELHTFMLGSNCKLKLQTAAGGKYVVSYLHGKAKRVVLNFVFRKTGLVARIYSDNVNRYAEMLETLPDAMIKLIAKSGDCRSCNARCPKGYEFVIGGTQYNKCRYGCFMFPVDGVNAPAIRAFVEREATARNA